MAKIDFNNSSAHFERVAANHQRDTLSTRYCSFKNECEETSEINQIFDAHYLVIEKKMSEFVDYMQRQMQRKIPMDHETVINEGIQSIRNAEHPPEHQYKSPSPNTCIINETQNQLILSMPILENVSGIATNQELQSTKSDIDSDDSFSQISYHM